MDEQSCLTRRLAAYIDLTGPERDYLSAIERDSRTLAKGDPLPIGADGNAVGVLDTGWAVAVDMRHRTQRITQIYLAGDVVGLAELGGDFEGQELKMQTGGVFCPFPRAEIGRLLTDLPRLAALFLALSGLEQLALRDRLAAESALRAEDRLVLFLLDLRARLALPDIGSGNRFGLPMTQAEIGRVIGTSDITVNKALRALVQRGWVEYERPYIRLRDRAAMERRVRFTDRYARIGDGWFPPAA